MGFAGGSYNKNSFGLFFHCPINITVTDQYGRIIDDDGTNDIPNAKIHVVGDLKIFQIPVELNYTVNIDAYDSGNFSFTQISPLTNKSASMISFVDVSINENTKVIIDVSSANPNYLMQIDSDGDGTTDDTKEPDIIDIIIVDHTPPSPITNLTPTPGTTWLNFTWTNPIDPDFNHTELYLNGTFLTNIPAPQNYYNITGLLPDTSYELGTRTVDINGNINLTWVNATASTLPASCTTLNLYTGWNLISLPLMPEDTSITSLLSPINGNCSIVWEYNASDTSDHWKKYDPSAPFGNDLINMEPGKGYWIMMISDDTLPISGTVPESTDINLKTDWNLIGYNSPDSQPVAEALSSISSNYTIVWAYDANDTADHWKKYDPGAPFGNDLTDMESGKGYWIMMTSDDILEI